MSIISANLQNEKCKNNRSYSFCVGGGRAYETLVAENQRQLAEVHDNCGFRYMRCHGLLHDDMAVYQEDKFGKPYYNWQYIDLLYDAMLKIGVKPFVELSFMPKKLASGDNTVFFWRGNITQPNNADKLADLIEALAVHLIERYGKEEVESWYFEVWNEPNLDIFFTSDSPFEDYMKLYALMARAVKKADPLLRVGGPATAGCAWISDFIKACKRDNLPLDFISTHSYGVNGYVDEFGENFQKLVQDENSVSGEINSVREEIKKSCSPDLELHITEWNSSFSPRDNVHDSYFNAAFIVDRVKKSFCNVDSMSYWTFSDIFEECGAGPAPFHGGFGLINVTGIRKPSFYAFKYLNMLGDVILNGGSDCSICTKSGDGAQVLFWNCTMPKTDVSNQEYFTRDLPSKKVDDVCIELSGLEPGTYEFDLYGTGYRMNDPYTLYYELNIKKGLTQDQEKYIKESCDGSPLIKKVVKIDESGSFSYKRELRENDVYLITLKKL